MIYEGTSITTFFFSKSKYLLWITSVNTLIRLRYIKVSSRNKKDLEVYASIYCRNENDATRVCSKKTLQQNMTDVDPFSCRGGKDLTLKNQIVPANRIKNYFFSKAIVLTDIQESAISFFQEI